MPELPDWMRASTILGTDGVDYLPVLLAPDGSMYAVLQGEYEGALKTVKLDDEGRISAFVIDSVDAWGRMLSIGNAELAVRLGSPVAYDRRGQVVVAENFEAGWARWRPNTGGAGAAVEITPTTAASGGYSLKLTGGSDGIRKAGIDRFVSAWPAGRMGLEFSFALPGPWDSLNGVMILDDGSNIHTMYVKFTYSTGNLEIYDESLGWVIVGTGQALGINLRWFNTLKIVANIDTLKFVRLMYNQQEIDISAYDVLTGPGGTAPRIDVQINFNSRAGNNDVMYLDDIIVTAAEPA